MACCKTTATQMAIRSPSRWSRMSATEH
ncbi:hypothetical protein R2601_04563 [Salipiger bermudensis HTCC2601]|uniref:Uncharacterized protein n=1 Tax=Salipiger bermudensis (strain DSM 26914 / JCM 13377 / KCTC 12554 / HTCC2601) TaxID=314265 RepID=Q0FVT3_SALBH|nr:hypothetical protein R2601_04563 [Salipiger bermudensis HTCC2601]